MIVATGVELSNRLTYEIFQTNGIFVQLFRWFIATTLIVSRSSVVVQY